MGNQDLQALIKSRNRDMAERLNKEIEDWKHSISVYEKLLEWPAGCAQTLAAQEMQKFFELCGDLVEYEPTRMDASEKSISELNEIAGGDYWKPIIVAYKKGEIDGYDAEALFADEASCRVYEDLMLNGKIKTNGASRLLLREPLMEIAAEFTENAGTPQSLIAQYKSYMQNNINDSGYVKAIERQQGD